MTALLARLFPKPAPVIGVAVTHRLTDEPCPIETIGHAIAQAQKQLRRQVRDLEHLRNCEAAPCLIHRAEEQCAKTRAVITTRELRRAAMIAEGL